MSDQTKERCPECQSTVRVVHFRRGEDRTWHTSCPDCRAAGCEVCKNPWHGVGHDVSPVIPTNWHDLMCSCGHKQSRHDPEDGNCEAGPPCEPRCMAFRQEETFTDTEIEEELVEQMWKVAPVAPAVAKELIREITADLMDSIPNADGEVIAKLLTEHLAEYAASLSQDEQIVELQRSLTRERATVSDRNHIIIEKAKQVKQLQSERDALVAQAKEYNAMTNRAQDRAEAAERSLETARKLLKRLVLNTGYKCEGYKDKTHAEMMANPYHLQACCACAVEAYLNPESALSGEGK
jgi:hypothetical protein